MENTFLATLPIAHRGLHDHEKPENSTAAFRAAISAGYAIETDVRLSRDGELVVFHDDTLTRMTGVNKPVETLDASELTRLRLADTQECIPLFSDFLNELGGSVPLLLEIKNVPNADTKEYLRKIACALEEYRKKFDGEVAIQSFNPFYMQKMKKIFPGVPYGVLGTATSAKEDFGGSALWRFKARAVKNMSFNKRVDPTFISYNFWDFPQKSVNKFQGIKLAWTVRSPEEERNARKYADNIIFENYLPEK
jgi:glycerophosphoryl diester phosphodiesterase